jgi:hypothetical protein
VAEKKRSETKAEYDERLRTETEESENIIIEFENNKSQQISAFLKEAQEIIQFAYSNKVGSAKAGSDVNGVINAGIRLLKTSPNDSTTRDFIILISDGVDNVKKPLNEIADNVRVLLVNNSGSKCRLGIDVVELDNLSRMEEYIFNK